MCSNIYSAEKGKTHNIIKLEKSVIRKIIAVLDYNEPRKELIESLKESLEVYYYELCQKGNEYSLHDKVGSFIRLTRFLLDYPVKSNIESKIVESIYEKMRLVDMSTFCLNQLCSITISESMISRFLEYMKDTKIGKLCIFYLYRVNSKYISSKYGLLIQVEELSVKELYYSITTGFYEYGKDGNKAVERLKVMQANEVLDKLAHDGFIID